MKIAKRRSTLLLGAIVAGALCLGGTTAAAASVGDVSKGSVDAPSQTSDASTSYSAKLVVVSATGAESIDISRADATVATILESRGYSLENLKDDKGQSVDPKLLIENGGQAVLYSSTVNGSSKTIDLNLPDAQTEDPALYVGQNVVESPGKVGKALKTTIVHRDLSKLPQGAETLPENLDPTVLSSDSTQTGEEVYITVLEAPEAKKVRVGTKVCSSDYLCKMLDAGGLEELSTVGEFVHPLGAAEVWTTYYGSRGHEGGAVDFPVATGTPIYSIADGVVTDSGIISNGGNMAVIRHNDGNLSGYAHMVETPLVKAGDTVKAGEVIGFVGSTGKSTGPHLHFEIWSDHIWGAPVPAYEYMKLHGIELGACVDGPCSLSKKS